MHKLKLFSIVIGTRDAMDNYKGSITSEQFNLRLKLNCVLYAVLYAVCIKCA